ncbi:alpha/beta hydrolase [Microvirga puerhi]|uniref:Alpha/beta hydrolase n=1 Tax=Microvirga puerhi TaxID=2876078 RepID=A0ABS7VHT5_9HYPH|nr:alpha/beta hydrolase [Microvirga puerhi]MBZ6075063.1 alpha/beta hydrolase [Microvirga puerhi]
MTELDLEAEYNNRARVADHMVHMDGWHRDAAAYRAAALCELDLAYGPGPRHRVDLFHPPGGDAGGPVVMFIHGGYWQGLDKSSSSHLARGANERGLTVAVPSYDLAPHVTLSGIVAEMETAADFLMQRSGRSLIVAGHSAGGHLAACLMARSVKSLKRPIRAGLSISGLFDLVPLVSTSVNRALGLTIEEARRLSPIYDQPPADTRFVAVVGGAESAEYRRQSRDFVTQWNAMDALGSVHEVANAHHFDVMAGLADPDDPLVDMLIGLADAA